MQRNITSVPHTDTNNYVPPLLHIIKSDTIAVLEEKVACPSIKNDITRRALNFLCHFITKILDDQLRYIKHSDSLSYYIEVKHWIPMYEPQNSGIKNYMNVDM